MTIPNHITIEALARLPIAEIVALPAAELARLQKDADDALRKSKLTAAWLDGALTQKYSERAKAARADTSKDFGVTRFTDGDVTVVADLPKKVEWDQHELGELIEHIKAIGDDPLDYVDVSFSVSERKYSSWPTRFRTMFQEARTVSGGRQTFKLTIAKEDA